MSTSPTVVLNVSGARGESFADVARRVGSFGGFPVGSTATDEEVLSAAVDGMNSAIEVAGFTPIEPVVCASDVNITLSGAQSIGGFTPTNGDRIGVFGQTSKPANGIYIYSDSGAYSRATDFDETSEVVSGAVVAVANGDNSGQFILTTTGSITVGTTPQSWTRYRYNNASATTVTGGGSAQGAINALNPMTISELSTRDIIGDFPSASEVTLSDRGGATWVPDNTSGLAVTYPGDNGLWWVLDGGGTPWRLSNAGSPSPSGAGCPATGDSLAYLDSYMRWCLASFGGDPVFDQEYTYSGTFIISGMLERNLYMRANAKFTGLDKTAHVLEIDQFRLNKIHGWLRFGYDASILLTTSDTGAVGLKYGIMSRNNIDGIEGRNCYRFIDSKVDTGDAYFFSNTISESDFVEWCGIAKRIKYGTGSVWLNTYFNNNASGGKAGTYTQTGTTITATVAANKLTVGDAVSLVFTGGATSAAATVTGATTNTFTVESAVSGSFSGNVSISLSRKKCVGVMIHQTCSDMQYVQLNFEHYTSTSTPWFVGADCGHMAVKGFRTEGWEPAANNTSLIALSGGVGTHPTITIDGFGISYSFFNQARTNSVSAISLGQGCKARIAGFQSQSNYVTGTVEFAFTRYSGTPTVNNNTSAFFEVVGRNDVFNVGNAAGSIPSGQKSVFVNRDVAGQYAMPGDASGTSWSNYYGVSGYIFDVPITAARGVFLSSAAGEGDIVKVVRTPDCTGAFNVAITATGMTTVNFAASGTVQSAEFYRRNGAWKRLI